VASRYVHVESIAAVRSRHAGEACGDTFVCHREPAGTTLLLCDGLGHGIRANMAATLCQARTSGLLRAGYSLRRAFESVVGTMESIKGKASAYSVISALRILNEGDATVLSYDMPGAVLLGDRHAAALHARPITLGQATVMESNCFLRPGEGVMLVSDGITQAGLGRGMKDGWTLDGVARLADRLLQEGCAMADLPARILGRAEEIGQGEVGDDCTVVAALCRLGRTLTLFTGPPSDRATDPAIVDRFLGSDGWKVVCGGTTAAIVADRLGRKLARPRDPGSLRAPPSYALEGVDLVTEGAVTLNQVHNLLETDPEEWDEASGVTELLGLMRAADKIHFLVGQSFNPASGHVSFRQQGILSRTAIVPLIAAKLEAAGKRVMVEKV
jgi:hypothetical protein